MKTFQEFLAEAKQQEFDNVEAFEAAAKKAGLDLRKDNKNGYLNAFKGTDLVGRYTFAQGGNPSKGWIKV